MIRPLAIAAAFVLALTTGAAAQEMMLLQIRKVDTRMSAPVATTSPTLAMPEESGRILAIYEVLVPRSGPYYSRHVDGSQSMTVSGDVAGSGSDEYRVSVNITESKYRDPRAAHAPDKAMKNSSEARLKVGGKFAMVDDRVAGGAQMWVVSLLPWPRDPAKELGVTPSQDNPVDQVTPGDFDATRGPDAKPEPNINKPPMDYQVERAPNVIPSATPAMR